MNLSASFGGNLVLPGSRRDSCFRICSFSPGIVGWKLSSRCSLRKNSRVISRVSETEAEPESNNDEDNNQSAESGVFETNGLVNNGTDGTDDAQVKSEDNNQLAESGMFETKGTVNNGTDGTDDAQVKREDDTDVQITSGSPLPEARV